MSGPASNPVELRVQRKITTAYIAAEPNEVVLNRPNYITTAGGGKRKDPNNPTTPLAPQKVRLVPFKKRMTIFNHDKPEGNVDNLPYVLIGEWDMDIEKSDELTWDGGRYKVHSIEPTRSFRTAANLSYTGEEEDGNE